MPKYYYDIQQGSPEWFAIRLGKMTASNAGTIATAGKGLETYIFNIMSEYYSIGEKVCFKSDDMIRGTEMEDQARSIYALETGNEVKQVGFIEKNEFVGCSPDGLIGEEGGNEIKCVNDANYLKLLVLGESAIDAGYIAQVQMCLEITERKWWDFIAYNPNYLSTKSIFIHRIYPDLAMFKKLRIGYEMGEEKIKLIKQIMQQYATI